MRISGCLLAATVAMACITCEALSGNGSQIGFAWPSAQAAIAATHVTITAGARVRYGSVKGGQKEIFTAFVRSDENIGAVVVDLEVYDARGAKVFQSASNIQLAAGHLIRITRSYVPDRGTFTGIYHLKIGVFSSGWKHLLVWNDDASAFVVQGKTRPNITITGTAEPSRISPGQSAILGISVSVRGRGLSDLLADIEVYHGSAKMYQWSMSGIRLPKNGRVHEVVHWRIPGNAHGGVYIVNVGVFGRLWAPLYAWRGSAATIVVGPR